MTTQEKLAKISQWHAQTIGEETKQLAPQEDFDKIRPIEFLLGEPLPEFLRSFYEKYDGEDGPGYGAFLGHSVIGLTAMRTSLEFAKTLVKPANPSVVDPQKSETLIKELIKPVVDEVPTKKSLGFLKSPWFKVEFQTGPGSMGGPYFYPSKSTSSKEREVIRLSESAREKVSRYTKQLHELELSDYNWDNLEITAYRDGRHEVNRTYYDFDNELPLTSTPEGAIKKKYFHIKWIPVIGDYGGNYIGIDLDPDERGTKGQVIIFGRDEEDMIVLANTWDEFLDFTLDVIDKGGEEFKEQLHLHEIFKKIKKGK